MRSHKSLLLHATTLAAIVALGMALPCAAQTTWTVTSTADDGSADTLRYALENAADGDTINITATGTIYLDSVTGPLLVITSVAINGPGQENLTIEGGLVLGEDGFPESGGPVFVVGFDPGNPGLLDVTAAISDLTITGGAYDFGGAVSNVGILTLTDCTLTGNYGNWGGAVANIGAMTLTDCTLTDNVAMTAGGAILNGFPMGAGPDASMTLSGCTLSNNTVVPADPSYGPPLGGAVCNFAIGSNVSLTIENSTLSGNAALGGGAIASLTSDDAAVPGAATVNITDSTLSGNVAQSDAENSSVGGSAIYFAAIGSTGAPEDAVATLTIDRSTLSENTATAPVVFGGALVFVGGDCSLTADITDSTLSGNSAEATNVAFGGAMLVQGGYPDDVSVYLRNSTLSGNSVLNGMAGAIANLGGTLIVDNSTLSGNVDSFMDAGVVGGIGNMASGVVAIKNTILANDSSGANLVSQDGTLTSYGYNLSTDDGGGFLIAGGDQINTDPMLGPLADNGGPTWTCALLEGSPAIDAADATDIFGELAEFDQRGIVRPQGDANDVGAFEVEVQASALDITDVTLIPRNPKVLTVCVLITNPNDETAYDVTVTVASLDGVDSNSPLPLVYGAIKPGTSKKCTLQFKDVPPGEQILTVDGTSSLGTFFIEQTVSVP